MYYEFIGQRKNKNNLGKKKREREWGYKLEESYKSVIAERSRAEEMDGVRKEVDEIK